MNIKLTCAVDRRRGGALCRGPCPPPKSRFPCRRAPKYDGAGLKTWAWATDGPGQVIMARSSKDDPAPIQKTFGPTIADAIAKELGPRGLTAGDVGDGRPACALLPA